MQLIYIEPIITFSLKIVIWTFEETKSAKFQYL